MGGALLTLNADALLKLHGRGMVTGATAPFGVQVDVRAHPDEGPALWTSNVDAQVITYTLEEMLAQVELGVAYDRGEKFIDVLLHPDDVDPATIAKNRFDVRYPASTGKIYTVQEVLDEGPPTVRIRCALSDE